MNEGQRIVQAIWIGGGLSLVTILALVYHAWIGAQWARLRPWVSSFVRGSFDRFVTTPDDLYEQIADLSSDNERADTRTGTRTDRGNQYAPDTDAVNADTEKQVVPNRTAPAVDADSELVAHLAALRYSNGKWRMSANAICAAVGGSRAEVLEQIRKVRPRDEKPDGPQFVKVGEREQYQRIDAKPLR